MTGSSRRARFLLVGALVLGAAWLYVRSPKETVLQLDLESHHALDVRRLTITVKQQAHLVRRAELSLKNGAPSLVEFPIRIAPGDGEVDVLLDYGGARPVAELRGAVHVSHFGGETSVNFF